MIDQKFRTGIGANTAPNSSPEHKTDQYYCVYNILLSIINSKLWILIAHMRIGIRNKSVTRGVKENVLAVCSKTL